MVYILSLQLLEIAVQQKAEEIFETKLFQPFFYTAVEISLF